MYEVLMYMETEIESGTLTRGACQYRQDPKANELFFKLDYCLLLGLHVVMVLAMHIYYTIPKRA